MAYRIGIVCFPTYGGSGVVATELGKQLLKKQYEVHIISSSMPYRLQRLTGKLYYHEVGTYIYPLFEHPHYTLSLASKIVDITKSYKLDLVHVHYAIPHAVAASLARDILQNEGIRLPIITTLHGTDITLVGKDEHFAPIVRFSINASDAVTAVSKSLQAETIHHFSPKKHIEVIYNFVDTAHFAHVRPPSRKDVICKPGEYLIVHVSNMRKVKRVEDVIKIFYNLQKQIPTRLVLVGDGPERLRLEELSRKYGINDKVHFFGKTTAVEDVLHLSDLMLVTSEKESFGLAALEAMAARTPIVSSSAGGLPELIENKQSGFICPVGDIAQMTEKCLHILQPAHLEKFKAAAYKRAKAFDIARIIPQYERLYKQIVEKK